MKAIYRSFLNMLKFIRRDMMLIAALAAPFLAGIAIRFIVPFIEKTLIGFTGMNAVISPYYGLFDILFASVAPAMFCFIAAMVMLEERDEHIDRYLFITGLGKSGYIVSRIVIPALFSFAITAALLPVFGLTAPSAAQILLLSLTGTLQGITIALLVVTLSSNKLEGMAITKLSSLIIFGAAVPYFVPTPFSFFAFLLPSFWIGKAIIENNMIFMLLSIIAAGCWIMILQKKYFKKL